MAMGMTRLQAECLAFLENAVGPDGRGVMPSFLEIAAHFGLKSKSGVHRLLKALEDRGLIRRMGHRARCIEVIRGTIICPHCGFPASSTKCVAAARAFPLAATTPRASVSFGSARVDAPAAAEGTNSVRS
jgi:repressor LexA